MSHPHPQAARLCGRSHEYSPLSEPSSSLNTPDLGGPSKWRAALEIMRFDKPIGTFLLAAPTLWGIALANEGFPSLRLLAIFSAGIVVAGGGMHCQRPR